MIRRLAIVLLLTGCGCAQTPIVPDAQGQLATIATTIDLARAVETAACRDVDTHACDATRTADYDAGAAFTTANTERTAATIDEARRKAIAFSVTAKELVH
jgi:hypothetical protein